ncbi:MAG: hypothetical protein D6160_06975 [Ketobacter sp.]|nr:MAG: hypothetical protein D6160_06975 [Ketobacter sp.]
MAFSENGSNEFMLSGWLTKFLAQRGLKQPDQRALYEYQVTALEYEDLKSKLKLQADGYQLPNHKGNYAAFVLYCAEWFRREYEEGWCWRPIWLTLGFVMDQQALAKAIPQGLVEYWNRPMRYYESERRNFLGSLFSEGGLPFRVLERPENRFQALLSRILKNYEHAEGLGETTKGLVSSLMDSSHLPQVFSEDSSVDLIAAMADQLMSLVRLYGLDTGGDPVEKLDAANPRWRDGFPIPLDESTGSELLNGLLKSASSEQRQRSQQKNQWRCEHFWNTSQPDILRVHLQLPPVVEFSLATMPSSCRFEMGLFEGDEQLANLGTAYGKLYGLKATVMLRQRKLQCIRRKPQQVLSLVALDGGLELGRLPIDQSQVGVGEVPVGFVKTDMGMKFCGQASFSTREDCLTLLLPDQCRIDAEQGEVDEISPICECQTVSVKGRVKVVDQDGESYSIRTGVDSENALQPSLKGKLLDWPSKPSHTYLGVPGIDILYGSDMAMNSKSRVFLSGKAVDDCAIHERFGAHYIAFRNPDGNTLLRRRIGILPDDLEIALKCGNRADQGSIIFKTRHRCAYKIKDSTIECKRNNLDDGIELQLTVHGAPPPSVTIEIMPNLESDPIEVELPYPAAGVLAYDRDLNPLPRNLAVSELLGSRMYLFAFQGRTTSYHLELRLAGKRTSARYEWNYRVAERPVEINLFNISEQIRNLLSMQEGIDQVVELRVYDGRKEEVFRIRRHSTELILDASRNCLSVSPLTRTNDRMPAPQIMLLSEPERKATHIGSRMTHGVATNEFELPQFVDKNGPWLILPSEDSELTFRPMFYSGEKIQPEHGSEIKSLQKAVLAFDPKTWPDAFVPVLNAMANNSTHSGWQFLRSLYEQYAYLPLGTFEVWRALINHPKALAMALFKVEMDIKFLLRLESEFPIFWEFMTIQAILDAARHFEGSLLEKGIPQEIMLEVKRTIFSKLATGYQVYDVDVKEWLVSGKMPRLIPAVKMDEIVSNWYQELIRARSEDDWPDFGATALKRWYQQNVTPISLTSDMDYRNAVLYLPVFAAAVASGKASVANVFDTSSDAVFFLRQVRDFDPEWFLSIYRYCLLSYMQSEKDAG